MPITATAPGKLILLGEYAVLEGAPAVVAAVDRRARVRMTNARRWKITAPQIGIRDLTLAADGALPVGLGEAQRAVLTVYAAVREAVIERTAALAPMAIDIDSAAFYHGGNKLGLGSSAAVAVALSGAMAAAGGLADDPEAIFALASEAHRRAQGGVGSSADVAASSYGGMIIHRQGQTPLAVSMPEGLFPLPVNTGVSASTPALLEAVYGLRDRDPGGFETRMGRLVDLARRGADRLRNGDAATFIQIVELYYRALADLGEAAGADIVSPVHRRLHQIVREAGGGYKPSGAGAGDFGLAFVGDIRSRRRVAEAVSGVGFCAIEFRLATLGVDVSGKRS